MNVKQFLQKHGPAKSTAEKIFGRWKAEKEVDDFLGTAFVGGAVLGDFLADREQWSDFPEEVRNGFAALWKEKGDSYSEVRSALIEKIQLGDSSVEGLMNQIQGTIGEVAFREASGGAARLAAKVNQKGYDIRVGEGDSTQFIQAKVYKDPDSVIEKMKEVNAQIENGEIRTPENLAVNEIDFAVNSEIYEAVKEKAKEEGLPNTVLDLGASREEIRDLLENARDIATATPLDGFIGDIIGQAATGAAVHAAVNAFLVYTEAKARSEALEDFVNSAAVTSGGVLAGAAVEAGVALTSRALLLAEMETLAALLGGPVGGALVLGAGVGSRAILSRLTNRRLLVRQMEKENMEMREWVAANR